MSNPTRDGGATFQGNPLTVGGNMLQLGDVAPNFSLIANNMSLKSLDDYADKIKLISVVPSLDTSVCSNQTVRFNKEAAQLDDDVVILTISADLPFAQARWCGAQGVEQVETLSDHRKMTFGDAYGVHILDWRMLQRAVFVLDKDNKVVHAEYVTEVGDEVNFGAALDAVKNLTQS